MSLYYYFFLVFGLSITIGLIWYLMLGRKNIPAELFAAARRNENSGDFEAALIVYETALDEARKRRFNYGLENKIKGKLKLLNAVIKYEKSLRFVRQVAGAGIDE